MRTLIRIGLALACTGPLAPQASFAAEQPANPTAEHSPESAAQPSKTRKLAPASHAAFILFEFDVKKQDGFKELAAEVRESAKTFNGEFLMREKVDSLFGGKPSNLSVISFPSVENAKAWLASPAFEKIKAERDKIADVRTYLVEKME